MVEQKQVIIREIKGKKGTYQFDQSNVLGEGGQAKVYLGKSKENGKSKYWAIKVFDKKRMQQNIKRCQDMMKEIESLVQLNKSTTINGINSIIHLEEVVLTEHNYYLVFEYCNGGDLRDMLVNCFPIKSETIQYIIKQVAVGLQCMHESQKIHRDIKPENVLLNLTNGKVTVKKEQVWNHDDFCNQVVIKICDLGVSKTLEIQQGTETQVGTSNFMCPEIVLGMQYDFKADVWALGSLTFELFIGSPIMSFYEPKTQALDLKLIDGLLYLPQLDRISLECIDFLSACLQFDPANRFDMNELINHPFLTVPTSEQTPVPGHFYKEQQRGPLAHYCLRQGIEKLMMHQIDTKVRAKYIESTSTKMSKVQQVKKPQKQQVNINEKVQDRQMEILDQTEQETILLDISRLE